jgi:8-oxo-dGTP pyrophosphatase MutT (NUDIX family)
MITFEKSIGAVIFRKTGEGIKYLLLDYGNGYWGLPKGHVEEGENETETLKREVQEETGLNDLKIVEKFYERTRYFYKAKGEEREKRIEKGRKVNIYKKAIYYLAETGNEKIILSHEHVDFAWLSFEDALERITYKNTKKVLKKAKRFIDKI